LMRAETLAGMLTSADAPTRWIDDHMTVEG